MWRLEKFGGMRVFWDGNKLATKQNTPINNVPSWFKNFAPKIPFEAVLWRGYQTKPVTLQTVDENFWTTAKLMAFDAPLMYASTYEERLKYLRENITDENPIVKLVNPSKVQSKEQLDEEFMSIIRDGGEGLIFRKPGSKYMEHDSFFKLMPKMDVDAVVVANKPTLQCMDALGKMYYCTTTSKESLAVGSTVVTLEVTSPKVEGSTKGYVGQVSPRPHVEYPMSRGLSILRGQRIEF